MIKIFKFLLFPLVILLKILSGFVRFVMIVCGGMITVISTILVGLAIIGLITSSINLKDFLIFCFMCFVFSNYGLFAIAHFILDFFDYLIEKLSLL